MRRVLSIAAIEVPEDVNHLALASAITGVGVAISYGATTGDVRVQGRRESIGTWALIEEDDQ